MSRSDGSRIYKCCLVACVPLLGAVSALEAAEPPETGSERTDRILEAIQAELELVRSENQQMKEEIDVLRAESQDDWLTEQRAEAIKGLVSDVLADADSRASLAGNGLMAGWSDDFFLASADGRFMLRIGALMQNRFLYDHRSFEPGQQGDRSVYGFETTTARLNLAGHLFGKDIQYRFELGYGRTDPMQISGQEVPFGTRVYEAWVRQRLTDELAVKVGLFRAPFTRETLVYEGRQLLVDRSSVDYRMGMGRVMGIELDYVTDEMRGMFSYNSGSGALFTQLQNPDRVPPWSYSQENMEYSFQGRLEFLLAGEWSQFRQFTSPPDQEFGLMIGVAGTAMATERTGGGNIDKAKVYGGTADVSVMFGGANLFAAFIYEQELDVAPTLPRIDWIAFVVQGGIYLDSKTEFFARYQWGGAETVELSGPNATNPFGRVYSIAQIGLNYYIDGQDVKFTIDGGLSFNPLNDISAINQTGWLPGPPDEHNAQFLIRTQLQLMF